MRQLTGLIIIFLISVQISYAQKSEQTETNSNYAIEEPSNIWLLEVIDSIKSIPSLCDQCLSPPTFKRFEEDNGQIFYRLRYSCDNKSSFVKIYNSNGHGIAHCIINDEVKDCKDFEAYTDFTFSKRVLDIWSCINGFNCAAKDSLGLFLNFNILTDGSACRDKFRELTVTRDFEEYKWQGTNGQISLKSNIMAKETGIYTISVMDMDGCTNNKSTEVQIFQEMNLDIKGDRTMCEGEKAHLSLNGYDRYIWSTGDTTASVVVSDPGEVSVTVTDIVGCIDSTDLELIRVDNKSIEIIIEESFYVDEVTPIMLDFNGFHDDEIVEIFWGTDGDLSCDDCPTPFGKFAEESELLVMVTDITGCTYEHSIVVRPETVYKDVYTANVFSPDGDGENDSFMIRSMNGAAQVYTFKVFNRWGVPVHEVGYHQINDESKAWYGELNGAPLPNGIYVYMAEVEFMDGSRKHITGDILLVR